MSEQNLTDEELKEIEDKKIMESKRTDMKDIGNGQLDLID